MPVLSEKAAAMAAANNGILPGPALYLKRANSSRSKLEKYSSGNMDFQTAYHVSVPEFPPTLFEKAQDTGSQKIYSLQASSSLTMHPAPGYTPHHQILRPQVSVFDQPDSVVSQPNTEFQVNQGAWDSGMGTIEFKEEYEGGEEDTEEEADHNRDLQTFMTLFSGPSDVHDPWQQPLEDQTNTVRLSSVFICTLSHLQGFIERPSDGFEPFVSEYNMRLECREMKFFNAKTIANLGPVLRHYSDPKSH